MLAYVFWHWPRPSLTGAEYEDALRGFHAGLSDPDTAGFAGSASFARPAPPWVTGAPAGPGPRLGAEGDGAEPEVYEDWYLVEDFAALGWLSRAAVDPARAASHQRAASLAAGGAAGVYLISSAGSQRAGSPGSGGASDRLDRRLAATAWSAWFAKPDGMPYGDLDRVVDSAVGAGHAFLCRRQLTLGPGPEFCIRATAELALPPALSLAGRARARTVWPPVD